MTLRERLIAPFRLWTLRSLAYLALAFPLGLSYFVVLVSAISTGVGTLVIWVGVALLAATMVIWRGLGVFERALHRNLLDVDIPPPTLPVTGGAGSLVVRARRVATDPTTWRTLLWLFLRFPLGLAAFVILVTGFATTGALALGPIFGLTAMTDLPTPLSLLSPLAAPLCAFVLGHLVNLLVWIHASLGRFLLGPSQASRTRALETRATELEARTRLAHELHDSIGHAVTLMVLQAGAGRKVLDTDKEFVRTSLQTIEDAGRSSMTELDRVLRILRDDDDAPALATDQPTLADLDQLIDNVRSTGIPVAYSLSGAVTDLPAELQSNAYRIVQEALTNVLRHARSATTVTIAAHTSGLELEVVNGRGTVFEDAMSTGRGIVGMRERVSSFGGRSEIGPTPDGGYRVWVLFPG